MVGSPPRIFHAASRHGSGLERRGLDQPASAIERLPLANLHAEVKLPGPHQRSINAVPPPRTIKLPVTHVPNGPHCPVGVAVNPFAVHHKFLVHGPILARDPLTVPNHPIAPAWRPILLPPVMAEAIDWDAKPVNDGKTGSVEAAPDPPPNHTHHGTPLLHVAGTLPAGNAGNVRPAHG